MRRADIIGIVYNPRVPEAKAMASALIERLNLQDKAWVCSASEVDPDLPQAKDTDLVITVGGDGTIIRAARLSVPHGIPILGINMGRLGFMTELEAAEAMEQLPQYLEGVTWVEERCMLQAGVLPRGSGETDEPAPASDLPSYNALNDVVVGRGAASRLVRISAYIDGAHLTDFRADAVIVSAATGSTGYNLSVGGPILAPESEDIILKAVAPHVGMAPALVLPPTSIIRLFVETDHQVMLSVDGYIDFELAPGDSVRVQRSPHKALFLRAHPHAQFYSTLTRRLGFGGGQSTTRAIQY
jgi:NAD+ kinase